MEIEGIKHIPYEIILERGDTINFYLAEGETHKLQLENWMAGTAPLVGYMTYDDFDPTYDEEAELSPTIIGPYLGPAARINFKESIVVKIKKKAHKIRRS